MELTEIEQERLDNLVLHFVKKKSILSGGHNGLSLLELMKLIEERFNQLESSSKIKKRGTIDGFSYFI